jgi:hypothetical protein
MSRSGTSLSVLLSDTRAFGTARLARLLHQLATELELALRSGVCCAPLSPDSILVDLPGTRWERARLPLSAQQSDTPELQPVLRELGALIEQLLAQLSLCVEESLAPTARAPAQRRADQPLVHAWRRALGAIARRCSSAGAYRSAAELVRDLERLSGVSQRIVARRQLPPRVYVCQPRPAQQQATLPKVMLRCA